MSRRRALAAGLMIASVATAYCSASCQAKEAHVSAAELEAVVIDLQGSLESANYLQLAVRFTNSGATAVEVERYVVHWQGGSTQASPDDVLIPPGQSVVRHVKIFGNHTGLTPGDFQVEVVPKVSLWRKFIGK